jgi:MFS superfamily sulfate permease-like transporter
MKTIEIPKDGLEGLKQNWTTDALSGFLVFLLALPLSLGIAKASGFPAAMGVLTAMIGGMVVSIFAGSRLTIKGPAAGLITVCAGAVTDFGALNMGDAVALTCGAIVVMSAIQFLFGVLKFGSYSDFFPLSAVHGMLAAIGVLIFAKQFPVLLGVDASFTKGLDPIHLYTHIPTFIANANPKIAAVGILSLIIIFGLPMLGGIFKKIPAPMVVLVIAIPLGLFLGLDGILSVEGKPFALVHIVDFWKGVKLNASFDAIGTGVFWKYVLMFLFVNSLESLLTVKAIDGLDPYKRTSDYNKDLRALSIGNGLSGLLGGLPMISEVARSSANVNNGAKTRWANFFHGLFLFIAMLVMIPVINLIPNSALAAMLIAVAYRLASPKEFIGTYKVGPEQLMIFIVTIVVTVAEDLLLGVGAGILTKLIIHLVNGAPIGSLFKAKYELAENADGYNIKIKDAAIFSNFLGYKKLWASLKPGKKINFDFTESKLVDHSFMEQLHHFEDDYHLAGGHVSLVGLEKFNPFSTHPLAARKVSATAANRKLTSRQISLRDFAAKNEYDFFPQKTRSALKYRGFPIEKGNKILYEENTLTRYLELGKIEISDITLTEGARQEKTDTHITIIQVSETDFAIPDFAMEPEGLWSKVFESVDGKDINFSPYPTFSKKYYLRGENEAVMAAFFQESLVRFLENQEEMHVECHKNRLLFYKKKDILTPTEIESAEKFAEEFVQYVSAAKAKHAVI